MNTLNRSIAIAVALTAGAGGHGCSNLVVKKVPLEKRAMGEDSHQKGFRYYLNRPYLVVTDPVLILERNTLVEVEVKQGPTAPSNQVRFLEGDRKGQTVKLDDLKVNAGDRAFRPVTPVELSQIRSALAANSPGTTTMVTSPGAAPARAKAPARDAQVVRTAQAADGISLNTFDGSSTSLQVESAPSDAAASSPASSVDTKASSTASLDNQSISTVPTDNVLTGPMSVIYLPDLDEQYAIKSKNWLAKSSFALAFKNGTELTEVDAEHDATTVTIALLDLVQQAIGVAQGVEQTRIQQQSKSVSATKAPSAASQGASDVVPPGPTTTGRLYQMTERIYIQQGVYRLNKPWEIAGPGCDMPTGFGLLAKLGLPTRSDVFFTSQGTLSTAP